jgi:hypothetical protein
MAHAPGCSPADYAPIVPPARYEFRLLSDVRVGDLDEFDRPVIAVKRVGKTRVRIACGASDRQSATLPVDKVVAQPLTSKGIYRMRPPALTLATLNSGSYLFTVCGTDREQAEALMRDAWDRHADLTGASYTWELLADSVAYVEITPGTVLRDGSPF